ncbi:hypothetical protein ACFVS2_09785 [Brevibacillus sp. NPDC058079]|uniref:hypothetical protein n=1 Tax=Brevibacillus sp. NPDC058079 TaxID=3346330 RepID=UPI0036E07867
MAIADLLSARLRRMKGFGAGPIGKLERPLPMEFRVGSKPAKQALATEWLLRTSEKKNSKVTDQLREEAARGVVLLPSPVIIWGEGAGLTLASAEAVQQGKIPVVK